MNAIAQTADDAVETHIGSGKKDSKGREIGYTVGLREMDGKAYAWVQSARRVDGYWQDFGVPQRSREFATMAAANAWAYTTARNRLAKLASCLRRPGLAPGHHRVSRDEN